VSLRAKLLLAQMPLALALALVAILSLSSIATLGHSARDVVKDNQRSVLAAQRMRDAIERLHSARGAREHRLAFESELAVQERNITEPGESAWVRTLRDAWTRYAAELDRSLIDDRALAQELESVRSALQAILDINHHAIASRSRAAERTGQGLGRSMTLAAFAAMGLGLAMTIALTRRMLEPLDSLSRAARRVGEGDLEIRARAEGSDEIAAVAREFNEMAERLAAYRRGALGELQRAQKASQAAIDSVPYPVLVIDVAGQVIAVNQIGRAVLGLAQAALETVKAHVFSGKGPYTPRGFEEAIAVQFPEGQRWLLPRATPLYAENGEIAAATVLLQDVTRLRRFDELKNDLVATVAHELRTPLTSLHMAIHICAERAAGPVTEKQADLLHTAREDCERLQGIVDDLLDLARLQSGQAATRRQAIAPAALVEAAVHFHEALARERSVELASEVLEPVDDVLVDSDAIQSVFSNLIANAIRYTAAGGSVFVRARGAPGLVRFEVVDAGPGLAPEHRARVFEKFFRVPGQESAGAGLGLAIAKEIVERHDGRIGVDSESGSGSTFWFELPVVTSA
jgi:NtrC-family two-component system sensor histidine kinase KinB